MNNKDKILYAFVLFVYIFLCFGTPFVIPEICKEVQSVEINISRGMTARDVASMLEDKGIIKDRKVFLRQMVHKKLDKNIKTGRYTLKPGNAFFVTEQIRLYKNQYKRITLVPGSDLNTFVKLFNCDRNVVLTALKDNNNYNSEIIEILPDAPESRIAFILPDTYYLSESDNNAAEFIKMGSDLWYERIYLKTERPYNRYEWKKLSVLASIIEREAKVDKDKPVMAGVFYNRLKLNMKLQSCATVVYAWSQRGIQKHSLTYGDLEIDSPFNTYKYTSLPPEAIAVPDVKSWESVIYPDKNDYLYFFAQDDGSHIFSKKYSEHIKRQSKRD